jgi:RimJ/RimL family protein N-acetyltransferase
LRRSVESWREQADGTAQGSDRATFIVFSDDAPIGIAALYRLPDRPDVGEVLQVWVAPDYRGTGAARDLMDTVFDWAADNTFRVIIARIRNGNTRALRFYRKYGFAVTNEPSLSNSDEVSLVRKVESAQLR